MGEAQRYLIVSARRGAVLVVKSKFTFASTRYRGQPRVQIGHYKVRLLSEAEIAEWDEAVTRAIASRGRQMTAAELQARDLARFKARAA